MPSTQATIVTHIKQRLGAAGAVVTPRDFLDLASRAAVDQALSRLVRAGLMRRIGRGLYYLPRRNVKLGLSVPPEQDTVAAAIGRQTGSMVALSGAAAANRLGLSTQIPARPVYITNGRSRRVCVGNRVFVFKHVTPRRLPDADPEVVSALQALHHIGADPPGAMLAEVRRRLRPRQRLELARHASSACSWVARSARQVASMQANPRGRS